MHAPETVTPPRGASAARAAAILAVALSTAILPLAGAAESSATETAALFLTSSPLGADVLHEGKALETLTPILLRDLPPGRHTFEVRKEGYSYRVIEVTLQAGEVRKVSVNLGGEYLLPSFPEEGSVTIRGTQEPAQDRLFQLPQGTYSMRRDRGGTLEIEPRYPLQGWLTGLDLAVPLALALSGVLTAHDLVYPKRNAVQLGTDLSLSPATLSAYGLSLSLVGVDLTLHILKSRFRKSFSYASVSARETFYRAREYFDRAESLLSLGQLEEAQRFYTIVLEQYRDSPLYPEALFKLARIHALGGEETMAAMELELLVQRYPTAELYDKACKALADLSLAAGEFSRSLEELDAMVLADPLFVPEEIDQYRAEILTAWSASDPAVLPRVVEAYERLVERYPGSPEATRYRFQLALYLHETGRDAEAAAQLRRIDRERLEPFLADRVRDLERELERGP
jgi:tetratricopeptide (TPR) repeat protein